MQQLERQDAVRRISDQILQDYEHQRAIDRTNLVNQPDKEAIIDIIDKLMGIVYSGYYRDRTYRIYDPRTTLRITV